MMVLIHCTGGPDITLAAHNEASRRASAAQVTLTDGVPMPVVSSYACPCQRQSLQHHAMRLHESVYSFCRLGASLPPCLKPHCYHIVPSFAKYVCTYDCVMCCNNSYDTLYIYHTFIFTGG